MNIKRWSVLAAVVAMLPLAACGGDDSASSTEAPASSDAPSGNGLSGSIFVSGSSTVEPITTAVAKLFSDANPDLAIQVEGPGTGDGFAKFCAGETDISDASRAIKDEEAATCAENGVEYVELKVAIDGLSVITSVKNTAVECVSFADLWVLLGPDATGRNNWSDADGAAAELSAAVGTDFGTLHAPYPDASLTVTAPGEESGTFDSFVELVLTKVAKALGVEDDAPRPDYTASPNDNVIIEGVSANDTSLGWVGFAFLEENLDVVKPLQVDKGDGCVEPTADTIASGDYPIARSLYIYVSKNKLADNPALAAFVDFYLSDEGLAVIGTGEGQVPYVSMAPADVEATRAVWAAR
ncbi:MAG: phosphate ABC transporter substrate-binding protein PstS family protein [Acidimicrobiia bacterium]